MKFYENDFIGCTLQDTIRTLKDLGIKFGKLTFTNGITYCVQFDNYVINFNEDEICNSSYYLN